MAEPTVLERITNVNQLTEAQVRSTLDRLNAMVEEGGGGCLEWQGCKTAFGYGRVMVAGKVRLAHNVAYVLLRGEIASGMIVRHNCDNPSCCNPQHLVLGTQKDNMQDCIRRGRFVWAEIRRGSGNGLSKLKEQDVIEIRRDAGKVGISILAGRYGVCREQIYRVINRKTWAWLKEEEVPH